ncbi:hypothetical protein M378DRAFT_743252 [Amanita muscaria Koide BX008]|uniref:Uncharacterized protein n=1 Tax=Amanita muscaria (strain Koide BX008) TaxID=946122 RepID=A0A0C2X0X9_AMAMK|nr:hypothetical protein M378DRAFT_743252 [Amanita muscaria Koide BX008]
MPFFFFVTDLLAQDGCDRYHNQIRSLPQWHQVVTPQKTISNSWIRLIWQCKDVSNSTAPLSAQSALAYYLPLPTPRPIRGPTYSI